MTCFKSMICSCLENKSENSFFGQKKITKTQRKIKKRNDPESLSVAVKAFNKNRLQHSIYFHSEQFEKNPDWCMLHLINVLCDFDRSPNLFSMHMCEN